MLVNWEYDGEEWDPYTILGKVTLNGDVGGKIHEDCLILDTWLLGLARGLIALRSGEHRVSIDTIDEPDEMRLQVEGEILRVAWKEQLAEISSIEVACACLATQLHALADDLRGQDPPRDEETISRLYEHSTRLNTFKFEARQLLDHKLR
jgi:hypothetical protein